MLYEHYIDYTNEASNDMTFLESIEHMRRNYASSIERLTDENLYCTEDVNFTPNVSIVETNNSNDCDLEILVNPQTGLPIYDLSDDYSENASHPFVNSPTASVPDTALASSPNFSPPSANPASSQVLYVIQPSEEKQAQSEQLKLIKVNNSSSQQTSSVAQSSTTNQISASQLITKSSTASMSSSALTQPATSSTNKVVVIQLSTPLQTANKPVIKKHDLKTSLSQLDPKHDKPPFSYSCLITMALKNSDTGFLPVSEIYNYIVEKFPYFKTAPDGWKNSIRHNLSLNKCFQKIETPAMNGSTRKACLWGLNRAKITRLNEEIAKWVKKSSSGSAANIINEAFSNENILKFEDIGDENDIISYVDEPQNENIYNFASYSTNIPVPFSTVTLPLSDGNFFQNIVPKSEDKKVWRFMKVDFSSNMKEEKVNFKIIKNGASSKEEFKIQHVNASSDQQLSPDLLYSSNNATDLWEDLQESIELDTTNNAPFSSSGNNIHTYHILSTAPTANLNFKIVHASDVILQR